MSSELLKGGCHCGAVRFRIDIERRAAVVCNCSICSKKGWLGMIVPAERFELISGADALETYRFHTSAASHQFCRTCGIHSFSRPRSHPEDYEVNVRCLDGDQLTSFELAPFDGRNWQAAR